MSNYVSVSVAVHMSRAEAKAFSTFLNTAIEDAVAKVGDSPEVVTAFANFMRVIAKRKDSSESVWGSPLHRARKVKLVKKVIRERRKSNPNPSETEEEAEAYREAKFFRSSEIGT